MEVVKALLSLPFTGLTTWLCLRCSLATTTENRSCTTLVWSMSRAQASRLVKTH